MTVVPPTSEQLSAIARRYGMHLSEADLASFAEICGGATGSYDRVAELYARTRPTAPDRDYSHVKPDDNPLGAWYVTADITETDSGPLAGRRVVIKDNVSVAGLPMMNGSVTVEGHVPLRDATVVSRLLAAGATIAGKAVCEDLCFSGGSHTAATGPVRNPWDTTRTTGGSSSGNAALLASGEVDLAIGGDQGGSVRMPASFSGVVGHKPTHGLVPYTGAFPIETTIDHLGPMTRTVRDAALILGLIAGPDGHDPRQSGHTAQDYLAAVEKGVEGLRIGLLTEGFGIPGLSEPEVDDSVRRTAARLAELGAEVVEVSVPWHTDAMHVWNVIATEGATAQMIDGNGYGLNWSGRYDPELITHYGARRRVHADDLSETVKYVALTGRYTLDRYHGGHYAMARNLVGEITAAYDAALRDVDVLVLPTTPIRATEIPGPDVSRADYIARALEMVPNTAPFNVTGHPATSVPADQAGGLPVGLQIVGPRWDDARCLRVAAAVERQAGGFPTAPPA
ncbi:amidase [Marinactinospora rubrisoli]|uniref:Amidase n=1 Tax=Marinactinospora rubrisoli TaxID=2715399 RepID=A0ABW2KI84_9ACTN